VGVSHDKIHSMRNFADLSRFVPPEHHPANREFLYIGRFHEQKNLPLLIEAFADLWGLHPEARLRLVGKGPEDNYVRTLARESPAAEAIRVDEWTDDPVKAYHDAWAVVSSSNSEGLSNVMVEALACGVPMITTDVSGARESLDPAGEAPAALPGGTVARVRAGMIVPQGDRAALTAAMEQLLTSPDLRGEIARDARSHAEDAFSEERCVDQFLEGARRIYDERKPHP